MTNNKTYRAAVYLRLSREKVSSVVHRLGGAGTLAGAYYAAKDLDFIV